MWNIRIIIGLLASVVVAIGIVFTVFPDVTYYLIGEKPPTHTLEVEEVELVRVIDGDTIVVDSEKDEEETVRLLLIDTPETVHPEKEEEIFGKEAKRFVESSLNGTIYIERGEEEQDKFGRTLAYVYNEEPVYNSDFVGTSINAQLIRNGFARVAYVYEPNTKYVSKFRDFQEIAKSEELNIWSIEDYVTDEGFDMSVVSDELKESHKLK